MASWQPHRRRRGSLPLGLGKQSTLLSSSSSLARGTHDALSSSSSSPSPALFIKSPRSVSSSSLSPRYENDRRAKQPLARRNSYHWEGDDKQDRSRDTVLTSLHPYPDASSQHALRDIRLFSSKVNSNSSIHSNEDGHNRANSVRDCTHTRNNHNKDKSSVSHGNDNTNDSDIQDTVSPQSLTAFYAAHQARKQQQQQDKHKQVADKCQQDLDALHGKSNDCKERLIDSHKMQVRACVHVYGMQACMSVLYAYAHAHSRLIGALTKSLTAPHIHIRAPHSSTV